MKKTISLLLGMAIAAGAYAQEESKFVYVTKSGVNLRQDPSATSSVVGKANIGDIHRIENAHGDWYRIEIAEGPDSWFPCISAQFVRVLDNSAVTEDDLKSSYSFEDGDNYGMLSFEKEPNDEWGNKRYRCDILVKNRQLQESGGTGVVDNRSESVLYFDNIMQPEAYAEYSVVYDKAQGLLWYGGYLWKKD